jgi:hypothetical protein
VSETRERQQFGGRPADNQSVMSRPARIFLAVELLLGAIYFLLPDSLLRAAVYCTMGLGMVVAVVVGTRLYRPSRPLAWTRRILDHLDKLGAFTLNRSGSRSSRCRWPTRAT